MFNMDDYEALKEVNFDLLPPGIYEVVCNRAELKTSIDGTRKWWNFTFIPVVEIDHPYYNRFLFGSCTFIDEAHPDWEKRGRSQLADVCFSAGLPKSFDIDDLPNLIEGKTLVVRAYHKVDKLSNDKKVQIGGYYTQAGVSRAGEKCADKRLWITSTNPATQATQSTLFKTSSGKMDEDVPF